MDKKEENCEKREHNTQRLKGKIMANREEGAATPNERQGQDQPQHQDAAGQRHLHLNWSNFKPEFSGKPEEDAEPHYCIQMIG